MIFIALLAVIATACGTTYQPTYSAPAVYVQPTTAPARTSSLDQIVIDQGFYNDGWVCSSPCNSYTYDKGTAYLSALVYRDGSFVIGVKVEDGYDITQEGRILATVIYKGFGSAISEWVGDHMNAAVYSDQSEMVGSNLVTEKLDSAGGQLIITIIP